MKSGREGRTHRPDDVPLPRALGDEVTGVHALFDLRGGLGQALVQVSCAAHVHVVH